MPAATSAPKATTRIRSVTGSEVTSACWKSSWMRFMIALLALASPNSPTNRPGWARWTAAVAASAGPTRFFAVSGSPVIWKVSRTAVPSLDSWPSLPGFIGDSICATEGMRERRATSSSTAARYSLPSSPPSRLWMRICSAARSRGNCWASTRSAARESPLPMSSCLSVTVPTALPIMNATTTKASQPSTAVLRCVALQCAARAVKVSRAMDRRYGALRRTASVELRTATAGNPPPPRRTCRSRPTPDPHGADPGRWEGDPSQHPSTTMRGR